MPKMAWIDGEIVPLESAKVSVMDHAHLYGDGLFEGIRIYDRKVFKLDEHLDRLWHGIAYLGFEMPYSKDDVRGIVLATCAAADIENGYVRLNVTRGTGLGLDPRNIDRRANLVVAVASLALYPEEAYEAGLDVITCSIRIIPPDALDPRVKCIGRYASNILAKQEANRKGAGEGLMLNAQGQIAEATGDNLFLVRKGKVLTPHPACGILEGITRAEAMRLAEARGHEVVETFLTIFDVFTADEAFLTGTAAEIIPMVTLDGRLVGDGRPGPVTRALIEDYRTATKDGHGF